MARDFPASISPRQKLESALNYAALAPTEDGWQPWYFQLADTHIELATKKNKVRESVDPEGRQFLIGCGAALFYLKLALKHFGCFGRVALFPDLDRPALVARIYSGFSGNATTQEKLLFSAIAKASDRDVALPETPMTEMMLAALGQAAAGERGWLDFVQSEPSWQQVARIMPTDDRRRPNSISGTRLSLSFGGRVIRCGNGALEPSQEAESSAIALAVVKTKTDDKYGWLEAGQTMARTILMAQALGLSWGFCDSVRRRDAREALRMGIGHKGFAQVILQFGGGNIQMSNTGMEPVRQREAPVFRWR
jgi:hypothetical protein